MIRYRIIIIITSMIILYFSCISNKKYPDNITRIIVKTISPDKVVNNKGKSFIYDFYISYYRQYRIYELPYHITSEINNRLVYDSTKFEFFIYNSKKKYGYLLKNMTDSFKKEVSTDSILKLRAFGGVWDTTDFFKQVKVKGLNKLRETKECQVYRYIFENEFYDSAYFYYDKELKNIEFSISRSLDSVYRSKLNRIQYFLKYDSNAAALNLKDFYINSLEFKKTTIENQGATKKLLERYIKFEKKNHFK